MPKRILHWIARFEHYMDKPWYLPVASVLAASDLFVLAVPTDGLLVTTTLVRPRKWIRAALWFSLGSTLGCILLWAALQFLGEWGASYFGSAAQGGSWGKAAQYIRDYGAFAIFAISAGVLPIHAAVILGAAARVPFVSFGAALFAGRIVHFLFLAWAASHAPGLVRKFTGVEKEVEKIHDAERDL